MADRYWAQPEQPGFGARLGQALAGGVEGLRQGLAWRLAERQKKEEIDRQKAQQDFINNLKKEVEKRKVWEHQQKVKGAKQDEADRVYYESEIRPYEEKLREYDLELKKKIAAGEISPDQAASDALKYATAEFRKVQTKLGKLELEREKVWTEEVKTPGRGGLGFETPQGQRTYQEPPTVKELPVTTAEAEIRKLIAEKRNPLTTDERKKLIDIKITRIAKEHKIKDIGLKNIFQSVYIGRQKEETE